MQNSALTTSWIVRIIRKLTLSSYRRYSTRENWKDKPVRKNKCFRVTEDDFKALFKVIAETKFPNEAVNSSTQVHKSHVIPCWV